MLYIKIINSYNFPTYDYENPWQGAKNKVNFMFYIKLTKVTQMDILDIESKKNKATINYSV